MSKLAGSLLDGGVGSGVDNDVGAETGNGAFNGGGIGDVECGAVGGKDGGAVLKLQNQFAADLAVGAGNQDVHRFVLSGWG